MPNTVPEFEARVYPFSAVFKPAEDIPGHWVGHCLELDVVTSGTSLPHAMGMLFEAAHMTLIDDLAQGHDLRDRRAPKVFWDELGRIVKHGHPVSLAEVLTSMPHEGWKALAHQFVIRLGHARQIEGQEFVDQVVEPLEPALA